MQNALHDLLLHVQGLAKGHEGQLFRLRAAEGHQRHALQSCNMDVVGLLTAAKHTYKERQSDA